MSFLYKALLKDNQRQTSNNNVDNNNTTNDFASGQTFNAAAQQASPNVGFQSTFAQAEKTSSNGIMWFVIAVLLLIVGLLLGFIWGNKLGVNTSTSIPPAQVVSNFPATETSPISIGKEVKDDFLPDDNAQVDELKQADYPTDKHVSIAVDSQGKVVSKVTEQNSSSQPKPISEPSNENNLAKPSLNATADADVENSEQGTVLNNERANQVADEVLLENIPNSLKARFAEAVKATESQIINTESDNELFSEQKLNYENGSSISQSKSKVSVESSLLDINELEERDSLLIPAINYQMHIFSSLSQERWVKLNGMTLREGDQLVNGLTLLEIRQNSIIWQTDAKRFSQQALDDYK
ncbi:MAG: general secretion pathway protein GspB [Gammaproteobacteria bacterium]|nr:general secretion pathway protein GspB [Gammaproteobacteria bacterium]